MNVQSIILGILLVIAASLLMTYLTNRSRCTLEQAVLLSGCPAPKLRQLIQEQLLTYRRKYVLFGPYSLLLDDIAAARAALEEIKKIRAETDAHIRHRAEEMAARIEEANRMYQAQFDAIQTGTERMRRIYDELRKSFSVSPLPPHVADALRVLGLGQDASFDDVRQHYRLLAKRYHPDVGGSQEQFIRVHTAYTCVIAWIESQQL